VVEVLDGGLLSTVQDLGRPRYGHLGVAASGAADLLSLRVGNRLLGNPDGAAAVEATLAGGAFRFAADTRFVLAGADAGARLDDRRVPSWTPTTARAGSVLAFSRFAWGARAYLVVAGGFAVPPVLGSASTHLAGRFGGHEGRHLRPGDRIPIGNGDRARPLPALAGDAVADLEARLRRVTLRGVPGAHAYLFDDSSTAAFWHAPYSVSDRSDRMGLRLEGPRLSSPLGGRLPSEGMPWGAVQVPGDGRPIVLLADRPTTGGYPVIATLATVDRPRAAQLQPRERVAFERIVLEEARAAAREQEAWLDREVPAL
jgi:antagonist of KipI